MIINHTRSIDRFGSSHINKFFYTHMCNVIFYSPSISIFSSSFSFFRSTKNDKYTFTLKLFKITQSKKP